MAMGHQAGGEIREGRVGVHNVVWVYGELDYRYYCLCLQGGHDVSFPICHQCFPNGFL